MVGILHVSGRVSLFRGEDRVPKEVVRRGGFLHTKLQANVCPSPARVAQNEGTHCLGDRMWTWLRHLRHRPQRLSFS